MNNSILNNILGLLGILSLVAVIYKAYKSLDASTKTNVISDDALEAIKNPETAVKLRDVVDDYHNTGEWNKSKLKSIL